VKPTETSPTDSHLTEFWFDDSGHYHLNTYLQQLPELPQLPRLPQLQQPQQLQQLQQLQQQQQLSKQ
jgi:hypothetical protein